MASANFGFLQVHEPQLVRLATQAEGYFKADPNTCLIKLRQFGELLAQLTAANSGLFTNPEESQADLLSRLGYARAVPRDTGELFQKLRKLGNEATHKLTGNHSEALANLKIARELGGWFHRTFGDPKFRLGAFVPPPDPEAGTAALHEELERLRRLAEESRSAADTARLLAEEQTIARMTAEELARKEREDRAVWETLAAEAEQAKSTIAAELAAIQASAAHAPPQVITELIAKAETAAVSITLDEATTRNLIDAQLRRRGWEVDTTTLRYSAGTRPIKGRTLAIAEWPTKSGPADYALFVGTQCIGVVEAKRRNKNVSAAIDQAQRYARGMRFEGGAEPIGGPWPDGGDQLFHVPFVFSANGRAHLKQLETESGIWFRDARKPTNHRRVLVDWLTPDGLKGMLEIDRDAAQAELATQPIEFGFPLRPYQRDAIRTVEEHLGTDRRAMLIAMATGTGKTLMSIGIAHAHADAKSYNAIAMCPPHLVLKWAREVLVTVPRARVFVLYDLRNGGDPAKPHGVVEMKLRNGHAVSNGLKTTLSELRRMGRKGWRKVCPGPAYFIVSKETGKLSYFWKHAYTWSESGRWRLSVTNADTGRSIPRPDGGYVGMADFADVKLKETVTRGNGGTENHSALWQADRSKIQRMAPLEYISRYMKGWWDYSIADELHQLANETAQGNNLDVLRRCARKLVALTGTMMGGYADDLFHIFYRMEPRKMVEEGFEAGSQGRGDFQATYGVLESIEKIPDADNACSRAAKSTVRVSRKPGASPLLFGKFLMSSTAFVTLEDIADYLPPYEETVHEVALDAELGRAYEAIEQDIRDALRENRGNRSLMSLILHRLLLYPDHPFGIGEIWAKRFDPQEGRIVPFLVTRAPELPQEFIYPKERDLIEDIREELRQGRRCQVYATFTGEHDVAGRLERVLRQAGFRVAVLRQTVPTLRRELWYEKQLKEGVEVVICHPKLVETGLDLLWFPTIYFYETGYSLHTLRQASRRSWRIGQRLGVRVKFFIYKATTQLTCLRLMGKKMLVALMMEGKFSGEGIHSMDTDDDMMAAMARELVEKGGVGQSADAIWDELKRERGTHAASGPKLVEPVALDEDDATPSLLPALEGTPSAGLPGLTLVHSNSKPKKKPEVIWPTGSAIGEQMKLFG